MDRAKQQLKEAVDTLCAAEDDTYKAMIRTLKMLHLLPLKTEVVDYPEFSAVLGLDDERFAVFLQIAATRRDKARTTPKQKMRREYMREYMRKKRKANPNSRRTAPAS